MSPQANPTPNQPNGHRKDVEGCERQQEMILLVAEMHNRVASHHVDGVAERAAELLVLAFEAVSEQPACTAVGPHEARRIRRMGTGPVQVVLVRIDEERGGEPEALKDILPRVWPPTAGGGA